MKTIQMEPISGWTLMDESKDTMGRSFAFECMRQVAPGLSEDSIREVRNDRCQWRSVVYWADCGKDTLTCYNRGAMYNVIRCDKETKSCQPYEFYQRTHPYRGYVFVRDREEEKETLRMFNHPEHYGLDSCDFWVVSPDAGGTFGLYEASMRDNLTRTRQAEPQRESVIGRLNTYRQQVSQDSPDRQHRRREDPTR